MTDLVERLRSGRECGDPCQRKEAISGCICAVAADEIERLKAEVAAWRGVAGVNSPKDLWLQMRADGL